MGPGIWPEGWLEWSPHPLGGAVGSDHVQYPDFTPDTSEVAVGFLVFCILFIICPNCACMQLFLVPYSFFCCSRRLLSRCRHCSKGSQVLSPSLSQRGLVKELSIQGTWTVLQSLCRQLVGWLGRRGITVFFFFFFFSGFFVFLGPPLLHMEVPGLGA